MSGLFREDGLRPRQGARASPPRRLPGRGARRRPGSRSKLLPLLPREHRELIAECARGRTRVRHAVNGLDLLALVEDADVESSDAATIQAFFDERTVDVAIGSAVSDGPYPIAFDWAVVLDTQAHTLFSFIVNCRD